MFLLLSVDIDEFSLEIMFGLSPDDFANYILKHRILLISLGIGAGAWALFKKWRSGGTCHSLARLDGKTVIITGANTGVGKETALDLSRRGARVILACRDTKKGEDAAKDVRFKTGNPAAVFKKLDLASFRSIRAFAQDVLKSEPKIHILINNAGVACIPESKTEDGFETHFAVNHLGHFLLTSLLLDRIKESTPARIINVASSAYSGGKIHFDDINMEKNYMYFLKPLAVYQQSKLANVLFTRELAKRLEGTNVTTYSVQPGLVHTQIIRFKRKAFNLMWFLYLLLFSKTPKEGAQTSIYCAVDGEIANESGYYYCDCRKTQLLPHARDEAVAKKLWEISETFTGITS